MKQSIMQDTGCIDVGIKEIRQLTGFIRETCGVDYTEYALTSFKRCVEGFLTANRYNMEILFKKLESKEFLDYFVGCIAVKSTELFRDPSFWMLLKNNYLDNIFKEQSKIRIWLPMCASGEEFYSLIILLKESGWIENAQIYVSSMSDKTLKSIQQGCIESEKLEISTKNYSRFQGSAQLNDYFKKTDNEFIFDQSMIAGTHFFREGLGFDHDLPPLHLILFRNQLIYFNSTLQYKVCNMLYTKLAVKGLLALGVLEEIELTLNNRFTVLNKIESIYQRKM